MAYSGKKALIKVGGAPVTMTAEATTNVGGDNKTYQITNAVKRIIDINSPITVKVGGNAVTTGFVIDTLTGTVVFDAASARTVTIDGKYVPTSAAAECKEWNLNINGGLLDVSKFQDEWINNIPGLKSAEGSLSRWLSIDTYFFDSLVAGKPVVIELYAQDNLNPDKVWALISSKEMSAVVDGALEESVSFESTNKMLMSYVS